MINKLARYASVVFVLSINAAGSALAQSSAEQVLGAPTDPRFNFLPGYLQREALPDSLVLLTPAPASESATFARDEAARKDTIALRGTPRWMQAKIDADLIFPRPADNFSCALGVKIDTAQTPRLYALMQKVMTDAGLSTYRVKNQFKRVRPFMQHTEGTCTPEDEKILREDGSYPSGHTAAGWSWALILAELNPARANQLFDRGLTFGQSRVICNAHWQSDVDAGRIMGSATVARLHADEVFQTDLKAAREEVQKALQAQDKPVLDCAAETSALSAR